jgi:hypothetical protein
MGGQNATNSKGELIGAGDLELLSLRIRTKVVSYYSMI